MWKINKKVIVSLIFIASFSVVGLAHTGAWVDEVIFSTETEQIKAVERMLAGEADLFAYAIDNPEAVKLIEENPDVLYYVNSYGNYNEFTFNPYPADPAVEVKEFKDGRLNPFAVPAIREAINWLIDRDYIANEICKGLAIPRYLPITPTFPDYARVLDKARELEAKYAHNPQKAKEVIFAEMEKLGAEFINGKWYYKGNPVEIIILIRLEDKRKEMGHYLADLLEELGFTVVRKEGTMADHAPCWIRTDPAEGCFHIYTGGWLSTVISRDEGDNFDFFYTKRGLPLPLWQAYYVDPEADKIFERLSAGKYASIEERIELMKQALEYAMENSVRVWITNDKPVFAMRKGLKVTYDLAAGVYGADLWPYTIHWTDEEGNPKPGGSVRVLIGDLFTDPWNPIGGSSNVYDLMPASATGTKATMADPFTGLYLPQRVARAEVYAVEGTPTTVTYDWVKLEFVDEIEVPADAWIDWDATAQRFITVGEKHPEGLTARVKVVIEYDPQFLNDVWHDGSGFTVADALIGFILDFDRAKPESAIYDESVVPDFETFMKYFRGVKILSTDPFVVEYYTDQVYPDAEWIAAGVAETFDGCHYYDVPAPWHSIAVGMLAEAAKEAAFTSDKADALGVEWMNYIAGPTVDVLKKYLDKAIEEKFIPYANILKDFGVTEEEALARYQNLKKWFEAKGHFWVGNGPFYLESVDTVAKTIVIKRFEGFTDPADKWLRFTEPKFVTVDFVGAPEIIEIGKGVIIPVNITFEEEPYPPEEIDFVKYLLFDAEGNLVAIGNAEYVGGPTWNVVLTPEITAKLPEGTVKLEVAVSSKVVAIPAYNAITFVAVP